LIVVDDEDRENEDDLIMAAEHFTPQALAFYMRHTSGLICAPLPPEVADRLGLPPMVRDNEDAAGTAYTVSVDAAEGIESGISAADRARTLRVLAGLDTTAGMVRRPGTCSRCAPDLVASPSARPHGGGGGADAPVRPRPRSP